MGREELLPRILMLIRLRSFQTSQQHRNETEHLKRQPRDNDKIMQHGYWIYLGVLAHYQKFPLGWKNWGTGKKKKKQKITEIIMFAGQEEAKHHLFT